LRLRLVGRGRSASIVVSAVGVRAASRHIIIIIIVARVAAAVALAAMTAAAAGVITLCL
jgi:hypothetical protein